MAGGTMRTSYYLVTAAGLAAAVTVYAKLSAHDTARELPTLPMPADPAAAPATLPALPAVPDVPLPPIVTPPDGSLAIPVVGVQSTPGAPAGPLPIVPIPVTPPAPVGSAVPPPPRAVPQEPTGGPPTVAPIPAIPAISDARSSSPPTVPVIPPVTPPAAVVPPMVPMTLEIPPAPVKPLVAPPVRSTDPPASLKPLVTPPVRSTDPPMTSPTAPVVPSTPSTPPVIPPIPSIPPATPNATTRRLRWWLRHSARSFRSRRSRLKNRPTPGTEAFPLPEPTPFTPGLDSLKPEPASNLAPAGKFIIVKGNKLIEGTATVAGDKVTVRQGALDRPFPKADVLYVAETKDEVYRFMLARVPANDAVTRLAVARWCMFSGLREQALAEAREILKLQPEQRSAAELARSLERSLKEFPTDGSAPAKPQGALVTVTEPEPDVSAEGATTFMSRAQPVLANQCMECHARGDHGSAFKLVRVTGFEVGPQSTHTNLRAVAAQLKKDDPLSSPLLLKSLTAHGGMKQPAFVSRQASAFRALEAWVTLAVGNASVPPMTPPAQPVIPPTPPVTPIPPATAAVPSLSPPTAPVASQPVPVLPPVDTTPVVVPPVLPTPASIPQADTGTRTLPPAAIPAIPVIPNIPPADAGAKPMIPVIPPAASLPKPPDAVKPASGTGTAGQFGTGAKPLPPPSGPANDEFDPAAFNRAAQPPK